MEKIVIAGHGSPKKEANNIEQVAGLLHSMIHPECSDECVRVAYLQFAKPDIMEALEACVQDGARKVIIHPYFLSSGMHVTTDIPEIIDKAGDFLIDQDDHVNAGQLYAAAVRAYPQVALYQVGLGYCAAEGGRMEESVTHHRRAVELEPNNYLHLNDLGYCLLKAGQYDEAEEVLLRAVQLAPPDYDLAKGNLEHLRK